MWRLQRRPEPELAGGDRRAKGLRALAKVSTIGLVSADAHVNEPRDLWSSNLPSRMREQAMRGIGGDEDGGWSLIFDGRHLDKRTDDEAERLAMLDPSRRFEAMRSEGVAGECIFPGIGLYVWMLSDPEGGRLSCRIYNEWIHDTLQRHSGRFRCAGLVPTWDVADAVAEVRRIAELGLAAAMLPTVAPEAYNHRRWDPLWHVLEETGLPVVMHQGTGHNMIFYRGPGATVANLLSTQSLGPRTAAMLATSGVLERHPDLHFVFVEYNAGWISWLMDTIDYYTVAFANYTTATQGSARIEGTDRPARPVIYPDLAEAPSTYVRRQVHATFQKDATAIHNIALTGEQCLLWGSDFPHEEGTYPHSAAVVDGLAAGLDEDVASGATPSTSSDSTLTR